MTGWRVSSRSATRLIKIIKITYFEVSFLCITYLYLRTPNNDLPPCINIRFFLTLVYENTQLICVKGISIRYAIMGRKINNEAYSLFIPRWSIYLQNVN